MMKKHIKIGCLFLLLGSCQEIKSNFELPILGRSKIVTKEVNGLITKDTIPHRIADFKFVNQDSTIVTNASFKNKIYVADFFFINCPSICPEMSKQMYRVYEKFLENEHVSLLSHTIDPSYDTVAALANYARLLGVNSTKWQFVTGDKEQIYDIGETSYMVVANEDENAPGGFIHSSAFLLIDKERQVRGVYDGTIANQVDLLMKDIDKLLTSYEQ
ncbi:MAG: SCO family protein [Flammeovirgaceae bacterium]|nr:SCO family protein [Flammeovirgaceae bacterium]|tara:strand:+ start:10491 stop:11138 length:648 start_codon:yes stop_codon:yes gene_type:complete